MIATLMAIGAILAEGAPAAATAPAAKPAAGTPVSPVTVNGKTAKLDKKSNPNLVVCHDESVVGTLFPRKVCATQGEIAERRNLDQATTRQAQAQRPYQIDSGKLPGT